MPSCVVLNALDIQKMQDGVVLRVGRRLKFDSWCNQVELARRAESGFGFEEIRDNSCKDIKTFQQSKMS